ncbi:MAG: hypothetical protein H6502_03220 [Candidatus Woesearchaeota archaeon]|nr:MAG: hypothetical protein H6502_03220 [Candidatus Woesearchaeota archaeon]
MVHILNFCGSLCLPKDLSEEGFSARGIRTIREFEEGFILPMGGIATPLHILYGSKPIDIDLTLSMPTAVRVPHRAMLTGADVQALLSQQGHLVVAPDCALDSHPYAQAAFDGRMKNLHAVVDRTLRQPGVRGVMVWANNGIGPNVWGHGAADGVLRASENGVAYATRISGKVVEGHQRELSDCLPLSVYQNVAHDHIHIAPILEDRTPEMDLALRAKLDAVHRGYSTVTLDEHLAHTRSEMELDPSILFCVVTRKTVDGDWQFARYAKSYFRPEFVVEQEAIARGTHDGKPTKMAGLARNAVLKYSASRGLDLSGRTPESKDLAKQLLTETAQFYDRIL